MTTAGFQRTVLFRSAILWLFVLASVSTVSTMAADNPAAVTDGGKGGAIVRVTTLKPYGKGSLYEAVTAKEPRIIVFEVGGVIDLGGKSFQISSPHCTLAGQTAPSPGITLVNGGLQISANDVIVSHIRIRPGAGDRPKKSGWNVDGITTIAASNVIIDHCSCTWATDENLSASGPRFEGSTPQEWRRNTSHHIVISNCIIAEALSESTHSYGEHSKGTLIHDNASHVIIQNNLYACNKDRNPLAKGGVQAAVINNWIYNPGSKAVAHALVGSEWKDHTKQSSELTVIGNVFEYGPDTTNKSPFFRNYGGEAKVYFRENITRTNKDDDAPEHKGDITPLPKPPNWIEGVPVLPAEQVKSHVEQDVGARPWDRDEVDSRIVQQALSRTGRIIDNESEVGGLPQIESTAAPFNPGQWNLDTMQRR